MVRKAHHRSTERRDVPCNGCTLCCEKDAVRLLPEDNIRLYRTEPHSHLPGARMIAHASDGRCTYLTDDGCSIHDHAPALCRDADCRAVAARIDFEEAMRLHLEGRLDLRVWDKGRQLLESMAHH